MHLKKLNFHNDFSVLSFFIILIPIFIILGNSLINIFTIIVILLGLNNYSEKIKKISLIYKNQIIFLILFFFINIIFSSSYLLSIKGVLGIIKYISFCLILSLWLKEKEKNFKLFLLSIFFSISLVSLSIFIEYAYNLIFLKEYSRITGIFFSEQVAGSYISKLFFLPLILFLFNIKTKRSKSIKIILFTIISYSAVYFSNDRSPIIITTVAICIFILFTQSLDIKNKLSIAIISSIIIFISYLITPSIQHKFDFTLNQLGVKKIYETQKKEKKFIEISKNFLETKWGSHFITAYEIGKSSPFIGNGIKSFRVDCSKKKFESKYFYQGKIKKRCATHPHNIYFELFAETGLIGLFIFFYFHYHFLKKILFIKSKDLKVISICILFILYFPIQTTGSYFSTFNGIFYFINLSIINFIYSNKTFLLMKKTIKR